MDPAAAACSEVELAFERGDVLSSFMAVVLSFRVPFETVVFPKGRFPPPARIHTRSDVTPRDHRRKGIATRLLAEVRHFLHKKGVVYFTVYTASANEGGFRFYELNGMTPLHVTMAGETSHGIAESEAQQAHAGDAAGPPA